jgi:four helix bundle protein
MCKDIRASDYQREKDRNQKVRGDKSDSRKPEWKNVKPAHEKLWIWQKAHDLHLQICKICFTLPGHERYNLRPQIERSSKSVKDNIAEGNESYYYKDKMKGYFIARKEAGETQNHLREMEGKGYYPPSKIQVMIDVYEEVKRGINGMIKRISEKKDASGAKGARKIS